MYPLRSFPTPPKATHHPQQPVMTNSLHLCSDVQCTDCCHSVPFHGVLNSMQRTLQGRCGFCFRGAVSQAREFGNLTKAKAGTLPTEEVQPYVVAPGASRAVRGFWVREDQGFSIRRESILPQTPGDGSIPSRESRQPGSKCRFHDNYRHGNELSHAHRLHATSSEPRNRNR